MDVWEEKGIRFAVLPQEKTEEAAEFLMVNFFPDEPICSSLGFYKDSVWFPHLTNRLKLFLSENLSLMAVEESTGKILAVRISRTAKKGEEDPWLPTSWTEYLKFKAASFLRFIGGSHDLLVKWNMLLDFLVFLFTEKDVFEIYGVDTIYEMLCLCTCKEERIKGLGAEIVTRSLELAKSRGLNVARSVATSNFSQKIFEKLGFDCLFEIEYKDYLKNGEMVFKNTGIHKRTKYFAKQL